MAISVKEVQDGKCYITSGLQVRRVLSLLGKKVTYEARGKKPIPEDQFWGPKITVPIETFAAAVERKVPCSFDPDFDN